MKPRLLAVLLAMTSSVSTPKEAQPVVGKLYRQIVKRRPLSIPKGSDRAALNPFLSRALLQRLDTAQACQDDYFQQHPEKDSKPTFPWLELDLFSGANEQAIPSAADVVSTESQPDGSYRVYVRLTYKESFETHEKLPNPTNTFHWQVAAVVKSESGRFVVDDVLFLDETAKKVESRLFDSFAGCDGPHWSERNEYR
jgi:hypothetical protein